MEQPVFIFSLCIVYLECLDILPHLASKRIVQLLWNTEFIFLLITRSYLRRIPWVNKEINTLFMLFFIPTTINITTTITLQHIHFLLPLSSSYHNHHSPKANPSLVHCAFPCWFSTTQDSKTSPPSTTSTLSGRTLNFCWLADAPAWGREHWLKSA